MKKQNSASAAAKVTELVKPMEKWEGGGRRPGRHYHGSGTRVRRGGTRSAILALLTERPMHGYEMMQELEVRTSGLWRPSPGSMYPALQLLEDQGFLTCDSAGGKKLYELTEAGRDEQRRLGELGVPWDEHVQRANQSDVKVRDMLKQVEIATLQVIEAGSDANKVMAEQLLGELRRKLYLLLADDIEATP